MTIFQPSLLTDSRADDDVPAWSPDGQLIAFGSSQNGIGIYVMDADGQNLRKLGGFGGCPVWSPDGQKIAFHSDGDIYVMDADGNNPRSLTNNPAMDYGRPNWFDPAYARAVSPAGKIRAIWGWLKQDSR